MKKYIQFLILLCGVLGGSFAQAQIISNIGSGLYWDNPATWVGGVVPGPSDNVVIANGSRVRLNTEGVEIASLTIGQGNSAVLTWLTILDGASLVITGNCHINSGGYDEDEGMRDKFVRIGTYGGSGLNSFLRIKGDLIIAATNNLYAGLDIIGLAQLELAGNMILPNSHAFIRAESTSTVIFNGTSPQQIYIGYNTEIKYPNLVIEGYLVSVTTSFVDATGNGVITGDLVVKNGAVFDNAAKKIDVGKDILIEEDATFRLSGNSVVQVNNTTVTLNGKLITEHTDGLGGFKPLDGISLGGNAEIEYAGNTSNQVAGFHWFSSNLSYPRLIFNNVNGTSLDRSVSVRNVTIESGAIFNGTNNNGIELTVTENWTNNGTFNGQTGTVRLAGATSALLGEGVNNFNNLIIDSGVDFSAPEVLTVSGSLTVNAGGSFEHNNGEVVFAQPNASRSTSGVGQFWDITVVGGVNFDGQDTVNHELYLQTGSISSISGSLALNLNTGYINPEGNGGLNGNIHFFKNVSRNGFSYLAFPVSTTLQELKSNRLQNIYKFDEGSTNPFVKESAGPVLAGGSGYVVHGSVNNGANLPIVRVTGAYNNVSSQVTVPVKSSPIEGELVERITGWNLVGNPFAFDLDWDELMLNSANSDLYSSLYLYVGGQYSYYVAGVPSGSNFIPSMQAFMVYLPNETGSSLSSSMVMSKSAGLGSSSALYRKAPVTNVLKLNVHKGDLSDATYVRLSDDATIDFDKTLDAIKMKNSGSLPSLYSYLGDAIYSINSIPATFSRFKMPLAFEAKEAGNYTIEFSEEYTYDLPYEILLEDKVMNVLHPIDSDRSYTFSTNLNEPTGRFVLHFENPVVTSLTGGDASFVKVFANGRDITVRGLQVEELAEVCLYDIAGRLVARHSGVDLKNKSFNLRNDNTEGVYIVSIIAGSKTHSERVLIY